MVLVYKSWMFECKECTEFPEDIIKAFSLNDNYYKLFSNNRVVLKLHLKWHWTKRNIYKPAVGTTKKNINIPSARSLNERIKDFRSFSLSKVTNVIHSFSLLCSYYFLDQSCNSSLLFHIQCLSLHPSGTHHHLRDGW